MNYMTNPHKLDDLRREVARICSKEGLRDFREFTPTPADTRLAEAGSAKAPGERGPFGAWLLRQAAQTGLVGSLAQLAAKDPRFPRDGDPEDVRRRLRDCMAEGDMFEAVDESELDWAAF